MAIRPAALNNVSVTTLVTTVTSEKENKQHYILVVGLGLTGLSVVRYLSNQNKEVIVVDNRVQPPCLKLLQEEFPSMSVFTGEFDKNLFIKAEKIIVSPGLSLLEPAIQHGMQNDVEVLGDIEVFAQKVKAPVIAITGSNGKSTVTMLVGEMAKQAGINVAIGGNIGVPALDLLNQNADLYVLELSSFQLETCHSLKPAASVVLNISADHMDRYDNFKSYANVKKKIYKQSKVSVINRDDEKVNAMPTEQSLNSGFTLHEPAAGDFGLRKFNSKVYLCKGEKKLIAENEIKLTGRHNTANALAALALCEAVNISMPDMLQTLKEFGGLPHRTQWIAKKQGIDWYNDSKGTNIGATLAAIEGLKTKNKIILIAGGIAKDADFLPLKKAVLKKVRQIILIGRDASKIEQALQNAVPMIRAKNMHDAVRISANFAHEGDSVLLSPACASFDMFRGFEHRGDVFSEAVRSL